MTRPPTALVLVAALVACGGRDQEPYGTCRSAATCAESVNLCIPFHNNRTGRTANLCTKPCATNLDCPSRGVCVPITVGGYTRLCLERCQNDSACTFAGGFCAMVRDGDMACVP